jgi:hypothetical protein
MAAPIRFDLTYSIKDYFFDRIRVRNAITDAEGKILSRIGAFIRQTAQYTVLRRRQRVSDPGEAPSVHSTDVVVTLRNILFAYDPSQHAVIVGPVKLNKGVTAFVDGNISVPQLLEFGGAAILHEEGRVDKNGNVVWMTANPARPSRVKRPTRTRVAQYKARPFMRKALEIEVGRGTIRDAWRASIVGG